jgi:hypothetical protein
MAWIGRQTEQRRDSKYLGGDSVRYTNLATMLLHPDLQRKLTEIESTENALKSPEDLIGMCQYCGYLGFCEIINLRLRRIRLICSDCRLEQRASTPEAVRVQEKEFACP